MTIKDNIYNYIINSDNINTGLNNIVNNKGLFDDFKQHFYLQILQMNEEKLIKAYLGGYLDWLCIKIILKQWRSKNSSFFYQYKKGNIENDVLDLRDLKNEDVDIIDFDYNKAEKILEEKQEKWIDKQYHMTLFKLYFKEGYNYAEISRMTKIHQNTISTSIERSVDYIKSKIDNDNE